MALKRRRTGGEPFGGRAKERAHGIPSVNRCNNRGSTASLADDVNTACLRTLKYLRRRTGQELCGQGLPPSEATTTRPGNWVLVGEAWLKDDPAIRWHVWCQAESRHVGLRVQVSRAPTR